MTTSIIFIIISAVLLIATIVFAMLWRKAIAKNLEYRQTSSEFNNICQLVQDYKSNPDENASDVVETLIKTYDVYSPIMDDLIEARKEMKEAVESHDYPANAMRMVGCVLHNNVLWDKSARTDKEIGKDFSEKLESIAKDIKDSYRPAESEAVGLLVKGHIRPLIESLPNYRSFGEKERNEALADLLRMAFATIDATLYTRQADPASNENLLQMQLLRGEISDQAAIQKARKVTTLESETPLWAIRLNSLLQDLAEKYHMPKQTMLLKGYSFDFGA